MATLMTLEAAVLNVDSNDLSGSVQKVELSVEVDEKDVTTFASAGWKECRGGLRKAGLKVDFLNDLTDNGLDEDAWGWLTGGVPVDFYVKLDDATTGTTNPKYQGKVLVNKWSPLSGTPGDVDAASVDWPCSGAITRYTT